MRAWSVGYWGRSTLVSGCATAGAVHGHHQYGLQHMQLIRHVSQSQQGMQYSRCCCSISAWRSMHISGVRSPQDHTCGVLYAGCFICGHASLPIAGMDTVSFGPTIKGAHSPDERVQISTVSTCRTLALHSPLCISQCQPERAYWCWCACMDAVLARPILVLNFYIIF
jgi:hypothetical protein